MKFFFLDIETNSNNIEFDKDNQEIIQIWIFNSESNEKFNRNINIWKPISENIKRLTWITDNDLKEWVNLETALNDAINFLWDTEETVIVWHNLEDFDLYLLWKNDKRFLEYKYIDTLHLFLFFYPWLKSYTVQELYKRFINSEYSENHQALQDSIDEYELFTKTMNIDFLSEYYKKNWKDISFVKNLIKKYDWELNKNCFDVNFIDNILSNIKLDEYILTKNKMLHKRFFNYNDINLEERSKVLQQPVLTYNKVSTEEIEDFYNSFIKKTKNSVRSEQLAMMKHIKDVLNRDNENLFIEAWTWTWKTFWYLLPAIKFVQKNIDNKRLKIFIATYTKVLQNQIIEKDAVLLKKEFPDVNIELLKATSEWIALWNTPFKWQHSLRDLALWNRLYWWNFYVSDIHYPLQLKIWSDKLKSYMAWDWEDTELDRTYWYRWKLEHQLHTWNIFIINQAFLTTRFNPIIKNKYTWIIENKEKPPIKIDDYFEAFLFVDEWHNRESAVREYFTLDYTKKQFDNVINFFNFSSNFNIVSYVNRHIDSAKTALELESESPKNLHTIATLENEIEQLEFIKRYLTKRIVSSENKEIFDKYNKFLSDFPSSRFYKVACDDITQLRNQWYDTTVAEYDRLSFNDRYKSTYFSDFLSYSFQTINDLYTEIARITKKETKYFNMLIYWFVKYFYIWTSLLSNDDNDYFFDSLVELPETWYEAKNFWFKAIPIHLKRWTQLLNYSLWNVVLSATLFDKNKESYVLREIFDKKFNYAKIQKYPAPFDYKNQRNIYAVNSLDKNVLESHMHKFIEKYWWRTLILTTTLAEKRRLAKLCKDRYEKDGISVLMHKSWTLDSSTNQKNVQCLRDNPKTILIWSKSYAEWVDVPWDNLKLVVIDRLPFLPPVPFIKFQDNKRKSKWNNYVYKFLCSINFRQSLWRLIRTKTDSWDILILDRRILESSWQFFRDYIEWENIIEIK